MLYEFLVFIFVASALLLTLLILIQKTKGSMGLGAMGGSSQMLFGGSGGQDFLQKATWVLGFIFIFGSLGIALLRTRLAETSRYIMPKTELQGALEKTAQTEPIQSNPVQDDSMNTETQQAQAEQNQAEETEQTSSQQ